MQSSHSAALNSGAAAVAGRSLPGAWCPSKIWFRTLRSLDSVLYWSSTSETTYFTHDPAHSSHGKRINYTCIVLFILRSSRSTPENNPSLTIVSLGLHFLVAQVDRRRPPPELSRPKELRAFRSFRHWVVFHRYSLPYSQGHSLQHRPASTHARGGDPCCFAGRFGRQACPRRKKYIAQMEGCLHRTVPFDLAEVCARSV